MEWEGAVGNTIREFRENMGDRKTVLKKELKKYTVWFLFISFVLWFSFFMHGTTFVAFGDSYDQFLPAYLYIGRYLRDFFGGQFYLYDFSIGYGENAIGVLNLFGLGDPLNIFAVFATPKTAEFLFVLFIFVRVYLSGLGMILLMFYHNSEGRWYYAGGIMYAFSLYTFWRGLRFYTFLNAMYLLPFLIYAMERLIKESYSYRRGILFAVLVGIQACCGYYFLYFQTIFLFVYYLIICKKVNGVKRLFRQIRMLTLHYILGILLSGVFLLPSIEAFLNSSRSISTDEVWRMLFSFDEIKLICSNLFVPLLWSKNMSLGLPVTCVFAISACFIKGYVYRKEIVMTVLLFCMYISPAFWRISNGFSYGESRWSYVIYFWMTYLTIMVINRYWQKETSNRFIVIGCISAVALLLLHFVIYEDKIRTFTYCMLVIGIAIILWKKKYHLWGIGIGACVLLNVIFVCGPWQISGQDLWNMYHTREEVSTLTELSVEGGGDSLLRRDVSKLTPNDSMVAGYWGTGEYLSCINQNIYNFYESFLISPGIAGATHRLQGLDERKTLQTILNVDLGEQDSLSMGILYNSVMGEAQFEKIEAVDRQNIIMDTLVIDDDISEETEYRGAEEIEYRIEWSDIVWTGDVIQAGEQAVIAIYPDIDKVADPEGELYIEFGSFYPQGEFTDEIRVNEKVFPICSDDYVYHYGTSDYLVKLDTCDRIEIRLMAGHTYMLGEIKVYWFDKKQITNKIDNRTTMQNTEFSGWELKGTISLEQGGWLFLSIPYDTNWKAYVDDELTEIYKGQIGFMAIALGMGEHDVTLVYKPFWFIVGVVCSLLGIIICLTLWLYERQVLGKKG